MRPAFAMQFVSVSRASAALFAVALALGSTVSAQQPAAPAASAETATQLDAIQVTGSRLRQVQLEGATPITVVTRADIERVGLNDLADVVRQLPQITGSPLSTRTNNGGDGSSVVDLRGIGSNRTLVLVNGRRSDGDFSTMPMAMVERIEVLAQGASAVYGADAVAGVVNIITRTKFNGAEISGHVSQYLDLEENPAAAAVRDSSLAGSDGQNYRVSAITGIGSGPGRFTFGAEYNRQYEVYQGNVNTIQTRNALRLRDFDDIARAGLGSFGVDLDGDGIPGMDAFGGSSAQLNGFFTIRRGNPTWCPAAPPGAPCTYTIDSADDGVAGTPGRPRPRVAADAYNFAPVNYLQTPFTRSHLFGSGSYDLGANVSLYIEGAYANRRSEQILAPQPYFLDFDPPGLIPRTNFYNPFGVDFNAADPSAGGGTVRRRIAEVGGRSFNQDLNQIRLVTGLRGEMPFIPAWEFDTSYQYAQGTQVDTDFGQFVGARLVNALGPSADLNGDGKPECYTDVTRPSTLIAGCVPLNLFGNLGSITKEQLDYVSAALVDRTIGSRNIFNVTLTGSLFSLPAGALETAVGYESRRENAAFVPDSGKATDAVTGNTGGPIRGNYEVDSFFAEFSIPVVSGVPGADLLEFNVGARFDDYSTVGGNTTFQTGMRWQPIKSVLVRGSYGEVFREPSIGELFSPQFDNFPEYQDLCSNSSIDSTDNLYNGLTPEQRQRCHDQGVPVGGYFQSSSQPRGRVGGNPQLDPEEGETVNIGVVWDPEFVPGGSVSLDYWQVDLEGAITSIAEESIVGLCILGGDPKSCGLINRFPGGEINSVIALQTNIGKEKAVGMDLALNYGQPTAIGAFKSRFLLTRLMTRESTVLSTEDVVGKFNRGTNGFSRGVYPEWKANVFVDWTYESFGASANVDYLASVDEQLTATLSRAVESQYYLDLALRYTFLQNLQYALGMNNVLDREIPFVAGEFNAFTDTDTYRLFGRQIYMTLRKTF